MIKEAALMLGLTIVLLAVAYSLTMELTGLTGFSASFKNADNESGEPTCEETCIARECGTDIDCQASKQNDCKQECKEIEEQAKKNAEEKCIRDCVKEEMPGTICGTNNTGEAGDALCQKCVFECRGTAYNGPCITEETQTTMQTACETCPQCYGEPVKGASGDGWDCVIDVQCKETASEPENTETTTTPDTNTATQTTPANDPKAITPPANQTAPASNQNTAIPGKNMPPKKTFPEAITPPADQTTQPGSSPGSIGPNAGEANPEAISPGEKDTNLFEISAPLPREGIGETGGNFIDNVMKALGNIFKILFG